MIVVEITTGSGEDGAMGMRIKSVFDKKFLFEKKS